MTRTTQVSGVGGNTRPPKRRMSMEKRRSYEGLLFFAPFIIGSVCFFAFPIAKSLQYAFSTMPAVGVLKGMTFAGWDNFIYIFTKDYFFVQYFIETVEKTVITLPFIVIFAMIVAIILNKKIAMRGFFRSIFFLPFLLGTGFVFQLLLGIGAERGDATFFRGVTLPIEYQVMIGEELADTVNTILQELVIIFWKIGLQTLLFLSSLQSVSPTLYESAKVDGATEWEMFWKITLPMISPMILVCIIYTVIDSFNDITSPLLSYVMLMGQERHEYTYSTAMAWVYMLFILVLLLVIFAVFNRTVISKLDRSKRT